MVVFPPGLNFKKREFFSLKCVAVVEACSR